MRSPIAAAAFIAGWLVFFVVTKYLQPRYVGGMMWAFDELARVVMLSATVLSFFDTRLATGAFLVTALLYLSALWTAQLVQSRVLRPQSAGYDDEESALIREHALFFLVPRQSVRFSRTCYAISRSGILWVPIVLLQGLAIVSPLWVLLYFAAGALSHILDPAPLMKGALLDNPHDTALRHQVLTLERIIDKIVHRGKGGR